ncbi:MAG: penicillin-binding transpeptidase domain-containing protein [Thermodesulfobacteriota bacterium]|nr:penicillin-binding transpeptidase domain-containing protein [Thermodesulfobacteriota bacterium]
MDCADWRAHQHRLQLKRKRTLVFKRFVLFALRAAALVLVLLLVYFGGSFLFGLFGPDDSVSDSGPRPDVVVVSPPGSRPGPEEQLDKKSLSRIIGPHSFKPDELHTFKIEDEEGHSLYVRTTLDPGLQAWALKKMPRVKARSAALVVLDPKSGDVLAMASYRADGRPVNVALSSSFPAASLFKIVTAAAAVEKKKVKSGTTLSYDGRKHTLYRKHIQGGIDQGRRQVTLKKGFAESINTVFGKLGAFSLGPKALKGFAQRFHFNQPIHFEMPVQESRFDTPPEHDTYHLAEIASGFNRTTKVSPLHGAMLASAIVNKGRLMEPTVVREVFDLDNTIYYRHEPVSLGQVVSKETVKELRKLMRATVTEGTGRRKFRDAGTHPVLSRLEIGGKSGTINDDQGHKVDWFVSYARPKGRQKAIALAVLVVHGKKLGLRSQNIVREAIIRYFAPRLTKSKG